MAKKGALALQNSEETAVIGLLGEKSLHMAIKFRLCPDQAAHEARLGPYVADVYTGNEIFEVQTAQFYRLRPKLQAFLGICPVTVVFPLIAERKLFWADPQTGEVTGGRRSPKTDKPASILPELHQLGDLAFAPGLSFILLPANVEEYRLLNGWSSDKKKGAEKLDKIPVSFGEPIALETEKDCLALLPPLPAIFTAKEFSKAVGLNRRKAWYALQFLKQRNLVLPAGKEGNALLYSLAKKGK